MRTAVHKSYEEGRERREHRTFHLPIKLGYPIREKGEGGKEKDKDACIRHA